MRWHDSVSGGGNQGGGKAGGVRPEVPESERRERRGFLITAESAEIAEPASPRLPPSPSLLCEGPPRRVDYADRGARRECG